MDSEQASRLRQEASRLIAERRGIEGELVGRHRLVRGSLLERPRFCGKAGCKCGRGEPHPPSLYLSHLVDGVPRHIFIKAVDHGRARREALAYKAFRQALRRWRAISKALNQLWEDLGEAQEESYPFE
ncbi:MAG: hypothetical protein Q8R28_10200 [Dehalococcoidia bacterium]|nr:hypothetical protein [Dehalococcoidia bacterium]